MRTKNVKPADCLSAIPILACAGIVGSGSSVGTKASVATKEKQVDCDQGLMFFLNQDLVSHGQDLCTDGLQ